MKSEKAAKKDLYLEFRHTVMLCLKHPMVWCGAFALLFLNIVRYGFAVWIPMFMFEVQGVGIATAALKAAVIPLAGALGVITAGWISDRFFQSKRAPIVVMLAILAASVFMFPYMSAESLILGVACLLVIGFMTYGPHVLMVGIMPMDVGTRKAAASVTGFIDGFGYIGAALAGIFSGLLIDVYSWHVAFYFWAISAAITAILMIVMSALESRIFRKY